MIHNIYINLGSSTSTAIFFSFKKKNDVFNFSKHSLSLIIHFCIYPLLLASPSLRVDPSNLITPRSIINIRLLSVKIFINR